MKNKLFAVLGSLLILENIIAVIGIIVAARLAYLGIECNDPVKTMNAIVALLSTLALTQIIVQSKSLKISDRISNLEDFFRRFGLFTPPLRLRNELAPLREIAEGAKDILVIGRTAVQVLRDTEFFKDKINQKTSVRLIIVNPDNDAVVEAIAQAVEIDAEGLAHDLASARALIRSIREETSHSTQFELRVIDYVPTLSLVMIDGYLPTGHIIVEMVPYKITPSLRPHLFVTAKDHPVWYVYFRDICEATWREASSLPQWF